MGVLLQEDESALKEARAVLRLLDQHLSIAFWTIDATMRFTSSGGGILGDENTLVGRSLLTSSLKPTLRRSSRTDEL